MQQTTILGDEQKKDSFKGATYRVERGEERQTIAQGDGWNETLTLTLHDPTDGFQVGALKNSWRTTSNPVNLRSLLIECANIFDNSDYVGYWLDDEGMYHIDPSYYYSENEYLDAMGDAKKFNQKAIWSFIQAAEVAVAPTPLQHFNEASEAPSEGSESPKALEASVKVYHGSLTITNETLQEVYDEVREHAALWTDEVDFGARTILRALYEKLEVVGD